MVKYKIIDRGLWAALGRRTIHAVGPDALSGRPLRDGKNRSDTGTRGAGKKRFETEYERIRRRTI